MHFRFFGDSWFWTWNYSSNGGYPGFKSKEMPKLYDGKIDRVSMIQIILERLGHTVETFNNPGDPFTETVNIITRTAPKADAINVVFYSMDERGGDLAKFLNKNKKDPYRVIENKIGFITEKNLNRLAKFAHKTNQTFYLAGGQSTLYKKVFNTIEEEYKDNMVLVAECIISHMQEFTKEPFGIFKLTDIIGTNIPDNVEIDWEQMQPDVVNALYDQTNDWKKIAHKFTIPDSAHMNATTTLFFLDLLFQHIESVR